MSRPPLWVCALLVPLLAAPLLAGPDALVRSLFFQLRGVHPAPTDPVILAVDSESLALEQLLEPGVRQASPLWRRMGPWPWPRALQADLAAAVLERGARRVVFNIVHGQPSRYGEADDRTFQRRLAPWRNRVVLAASYGQEKQGGLMQAQLQRPVHGIPGGTAMGLTVLLQSPQGVTEVIPGEDWLLEALAEFPPPHPPPLSFAVAGKRPSASGLAIDFPGPAGTFISVPAWKVLEQPEGFWRGRVVLIGATAAELGDRQETPFGPQSGTEVQAAALASVLADRGFHWLPSPLAFALLALWAALGVGVLRGTATAARTASLGLALAAAALLLAGVAWRQGVLLPVTALVAAPLLGSGPRTWAQWSRESGERAYLHQVLAHRVSPGLLADILREPGPVWTRVGGSRTRCVVLFTDLVGFTPLSARIDPNDLFRLLNRYFEAIASAVIEEQGLLDKFIGDSLMAEFGVPRSRGDAEEALAAVRAALAMQRNLERLNTELAAQGTATLRQGIGLHFGEVIAGNLGSSQRMEFTVIGTSVNVASRLEALTRRFPEHPILISGALLALLPERLDVVPLGWHVLRGVPEPLEVFALRGLRAALPERPSP